MDRIAPVMIPCNALTAQINADWRLLANADTYSAFAELRLPNYVYMERACPAVVRKSQLCCTTRVRNTYLDSLLGA